ncbi:P2 gpI-like phage tail protein [Halorubrum phage HRTV-14]|uniref:P2 gpI-like phage tail protein n=1 Tax=Halorubrum phage HRTV-14 TaxID=2877994 RepID=A0AAE9BUT4_9CAUD|nr:P2 gpI-like phage tail protein [Halorubrum phage HRTV-14]UBF19356.1 P2 gpI-like phage tail protein [Halorubrum virus HRTV-19]UBF19485.1 P2 gpI-like phage tail protein [Halorubrum virus HRTV-23]
MATLHEEIEELVDSLPSYYGNGEDSGNWKLLDAVGRQVVDLDGDVEELDRETTVQDALDVNSLEELAGMVQVQRYSGESRDHYRARIIAEYQLNTSEGTTEDVFNTMATILGCEIEDLWFQDWRFLFGEVHDRVVCFLLPHENVQNIDLSGEEISKVARKLAPVGTTVKTQYNGSLRYKTKEDFESGNWNGYENGYDALDSEGNPTGTGGTKGGLIQ